MRKIIDTIYELDIRTPKDDNIEANIRPVILNDGVANYIGQAAIQDGNTISLSYNGSVGEAFYQPRPSWATDDVNVLISKKIIRKVLKITTQLLNVF